MRDLKWIKFYLDFFDSIKVKEIMGMGNDIVLLYIMLLVEAGKSNDRGKLSINGNKAHSINTLRIISGMKKEFIEKALKILEEYEMISISKKGVITITEFVEHQDLQSYNLKKEKTKLRVQKHREKQRAEIEEIKSEIKNLSSEALQENFKSVTEEKLKNTESLENSGFKGCFNKEESVTKRYSNKGVTPLEEEVKEEDLEGEERDFTTFTYNNQNTKYKGQGAEVVELNSNRERIAIMKKLKDTAFLNISNNLISKLYEDSREYGLEKVLSAIEESDLRGVKKYSYVKKILENWKNKGEWKKENEAYDMYDFSQEVDYGEVSK